MKEDGEWKFGRQDLHHLFNASYRNGWARVGPAAAAVAPANRPAARSRGDAAAELPRGWAARRPAQLRGARCRRTLRSASRQYAFPEISEPAFHYKNPVSGRMPKELLP